MPHKHTRRKGGDDSNFNLAPSTLAKPLPAFSTSTSSKKKKQKAQKGKPDATDSGYKYDDTPRAFARLMQFQASKKRPRSGLDDGPETKAAKKRRMADGAQQGATEIVPAVEKPAPELPKIQPGERLRDFAARVDQTMPVGGLKRRGKAKVEGIQERQTKTEKRLHKMYAAWREEDAKIKDKLEEQREEEEEANAEVDGGQQPQVVVGKRSKKRMQEDDPWGELVARREARKGLHDVVQAPPTFKAVPKEKFKVKNGAKVNVENIPSSAGSLKRREELSEARQEVIERYRAMMGKTAAGKSI